MPDTIATAWLTGLLGLTLSLTSTQAADEKSDDKTLAKVAKKVTAPKAAASPKPSHMVVVKDPVTGELRAPTAEEAAVLNGQTTAKVTAPATARTMLQGPGGTVGMVLTTARPCTRWPPRGQTTNFQTRK